MLGNIFWPCNEKQETRTSYDSWNEGNTAGENGLNSCRMDYKVAKSRTSDKCTESEEG